MKDSIRILASPIFQFLLDLRQAAMFSSALDLVLGSAVDFNLGMDAAMDSAMDPAADPRADVAEDLAVHLAVDSAVHLALGLAWHADPDRHMFQDRI